MSEGIKIITDKLRSSVADGTAKLPFCLEGAELWDSSTYFGQNPSNSSSEQTKVVGPYTNRPVGMTYERLLEIYYKSKHFFLSINYTWDRFVYDELADPAIWENDVGEQDRNYELNQSNFSQIDDFYPEEYPNAKYRTWAQDHSYISVDSPVLTENNLFCSANYQSDNINSIIDADGFGFLEFNFILSFNSIYKHNNLYYPGINFSLDGTFPADPLLVGHHSVARPNFNQDVWMPSSFNRLTSTSVGFKFLEFTIPSFYLTPAAINLTTDNYGSNEMYLYYLEQFIIEDAEFWTYPDSDGNSPLFSSVDGERTSNPIPPIGSESILPCSK
jgi:hypothetical protein